MARPGKTAKSGGSASPAPRVLAGFLHRRRVKPIIVNRSKNRNKMKKYRCTACEWIYDPAIGDPDGGIAPGTPFEEIPDDWSCPLCGVGKELFEEIVE